MSRLCNDGRNRAGPVRAYLNGQRGVQGRRDDRLARYGAGPLALIKAMNLIQGQTSSHTSSVSQYAALKALSGRRDHIKEFALAFMQRRDLVIAKLNQAKGLACRVPDGAFMFSPPARGSLASARPTAR